MCARAPIIFAEVKFVSTQEKIRRALEKLRKKGFSWDYIASRVGCSHTTLTRIYKEEIRSTSHELACKILAEAEKGKKRRSKQC